jgi:hypothetical protein
MVTIPVNITGGTTKYKSRHLSAQTTRNFWPRKIDDQLAKSPYILESFWGLKSWSSTAGNADRGMLEHKGVLYQVSGSSLYSFDSAGTASAALGTVSGTGRCYMFGMLDKVVIVTNNTVYTWDEGTDTFTEQSDGDFETPQTGAHLNNKAIYDGDGGRFGVSDVGDPLSIGGLEYATAESNADDLVAVYTFQQRAYMMGEKTIEPWWDSGIGSPPLNRVEGGIIQVGLDAKYSVSNDDDFMYWLADDKQVYALSGGQAQVISDQALTREITGYTTTNDAIGWTMNLEGSWLYVLTFPSAQMTWVYPRGGEWFEWSYGDAGKRSLSNSYAFAYGKHIVGDYASGNLYELDPETYTDNGTTILRTRETAPLHGALLTPDAAGKRLTMNRMEIMLETGVGLITGQGSDPEIMVSFSDDGGNTFGTERRMHIGKLSDKMWKAELFICGSFYSRIVRIKTSDPVYYSIHSAAVDLEIGV